MKLKTLLKLCYPSQAVALMVDEVTEDTISVMVHTTFVTISKELENRSLDKYLECKVIAVAPAAKEGRPTLNIQLGGIK